MDDAGAHWESYQIHHQGRGKEEWLPLMDISDHGNCLDHKWFPWHGSIKDDITSFIQCCHEQWWCCISWELVHLHSPSQSITMLICCGHAVYQETKHHCNCMHIWGLGHTILERTTTQKPLPLWLTSTSQIWWNRKWTGHPASTMVKQDQRNDSERSGLVTTPIL